MSAQPQETDTFLLLLDDLKAVIDDLENQYRWITNASLTEKTRSRNPDERLQKPSGHSDKTGELAVSSRERVRDHVRHFRRHVNRSAYRFLRDLTPAYESVHGALQAIDRGYDRTDNRLTTDEAIKKSELNRAKAAKRRREERGEGWGLG